MNRFRAAFTFIGVMLVLICLSIPGRVVLAGSGSGNGNSVFLPLITGGSASAPSTTGLPSLNQFINSIENGDADEVRGVYASSEFALQVVQQPADNYGYISLKPDTLTEYGLAEQLGVIGLLAHNNLAGKNFFSLEKGEIATIIFGDGATMEIRVMSLDRYQALDPYNAYSSLVNLDTGETLDSTQVFKMYYTQENTIVFQTCIDQDGSPSWGRLFVVAEPVS